METLAIIPARGGSKGIPRKNVLPICGKPIIAWTIDAAAKSRHVNRVAVSTDDNEIASVAQRCGADVVRRPDSISGDGAASESALLHVLHHLQDTEGYQPDLIVFLQCTSPLTLPEDIDGTVDAMLRQRADTAVAVTDFHYFLWKQNASGDAEGINHDRRRRQLRQDREPQYLEAGAVYVMRTPGFLDSRHRFFGKTSLHQIPADRCWEIDDPVDMQVAEVLLRDRLLRNQTDVLPSQIEAIVFDFDGVFTDNRALVLQDGREAVTCSRSDGMAVAQLKQLGLSLLVLSSEENPVVSSRCKKLDIPCLHGVSRKWPLLQKWLADRRIDPDNVIYVGNDVNDLECLQAVGCGITVSDAHPSVFCAANLILQSEGGRGAIRELAELISRRVEGANHAKRA